MATLKDLEVSPEGIQVPLADVIDQLKFNNDGLIPAIAQDHDSGAVLMLAWMDRHAIQRTLMKAEVIIRAAGRHGGAGETSGHFPEIWSTCTLIARRLA